MIGLRIAEIAFLKMGSSPGVDPLSHREARQPPAGPAELIGLVRGASPPSVSNRHAWGDPRGSWSKLAGGLPALCRLLSG
jgi:hypothetical protein